LNEETSIDKYKKELREYLLCDEYEEKSGQTFNIVDT
jgi:hypothetical protein